MTEPLSVVVLAAGKGTRMRNSLPKVLHPLAGLPILGHVLRTAEALQPQRIVLVLGPGMDDVAAAARKLSPQVLVAIQDPPRGTGHAVAAARPLLPTDGAVVVLYGDTPLLLPETIQALLQARRAAGAAVAVLGMRPPDPSGYGRLQLRRRRSRRSDRGAPCRRRAAPGRRLQCRHHGDRCRLRRRPARCAAAAGGA